MYIKENDEKGVNPNPYQITVCPDDLLIHRPPSWAWIKRIDTINQKLIPYTLNLKTDVEIWIHPEQCKIPRSEIPCYLKEKNLLNRCLNIYQAIAIQNQLSDKTFIELFGANTNLTFWGSTVISKLGNTNEILVPVLYIENRKYLRCLEEKNTKVVLRFSSLYIKDPLGGNYPCLMLKKVKL